MKYQLVVSKKAYKNLKKLPKKHRERILVALVKLEKDPSLGKSLMGRLRDFRSLRVWPYRVIYKIYKGKLVVYVIDIGHRQSVYK